MTMQVERYHVLVVEDDPDDVFFLHQGFETAAPGLIRLSVVEDGDAAMTFLRSCTGKHARHNALPHLILLDVNLPKESGLELLEWLRADDALRQIPVVVLSGSSTQADVERAYDLGANGYLSKDVELAHLDRVTGALVNYLETIDPERAGYDDPDASAAALPHSPANGRAY